MFGQSSATRRPLSFAAVYGAEVVVSTCIIQLILLGVCAALFYRLRSVQGEGPGTESFCLSAAVCAVLLIDLFAWLRAPFRYEVLPGRVVVRRHFGRFEIPLRKDVRIETREKLGDLARSLGNGGLWGVYGKYLSPEKIEYRVMVRASNGPFVAIASPKHVHILRTDDHEAFLKALEDARRS